MGYIVIGCGVCEEEKTTTDPDEVFDIHMRMRNHVRKEHADHPTADTYAWTDMLVYVREVP